MRRMPVALAVAVISGSIVTAQTPTVADELAELEQQIARAWVDGDREPIDQVFATDWSVIDITGRLRTKAEVMGEMFATGDPPIEAMTIDAIRVHFVGEVRVVTGRTTVTGSDGSSVVTALHGRLRRTRRAVASRGLAGHAGHTVTPLSMV